MGEQELSDIKKPRKTGLFLNNLAVKERFETTRKVTFIMQVPGLRGL